MPRRTQSFQPRLTDDDRELWRMFVLSAPRIVAALDGDLRREFGISIASMEVLYRLAAAPESRLRMAELADHLFYTRSGLTRLIDRLERDGLIERRSADDDARGVYATLTPRGFKRLDEAVDSHVADIRRLFLDRIGNDRAALLRILRRLEE